jgi:geranylgeranyl reductase family protein
VTSPSAPDTASSDRDVLVVGAGPGGASVACHLAGLGHRVTVVDRRAFPRVKTCGDALSPLAVAELGRLGLRERVEAEFHRVDRVRLRGHGRSVELDWPTHPSLPGFGVVARRDLLDRLVADRAGELGAEVLTGFEAVAPIVERGFVRGAVVRSPDGSPHEVRARYTVVADGANSRFGRALGTFRERTWPYATAIRNYWSSPAHDAPVLESIVDLRDRDGVRVTGYGWVFPLGDGTVNVGLGVVSTTRDFRSINTTQLLDVLAAELADRWQIDPAAPLAAPASGRIPVGGSVGPVAGPTHLVVGDAAGSANPLTGAGIEYGYATGRFAAEVLDEALREQTSTALQRYPRLVADAYGTYYKVGRLLDRFGGRPGVLDRVSRTAVRHPAVAGAALRIAVNELRPHHSGAAETIYRAARTISRFAPDA